MKVQSVLYNYIILLNWEKKIKYTIWTTSASPLYAPPPPPPPPPPTHPPPPPPLKMKKTPNSLQKIFWEPKIFSKIQGEEHHEDIRS